MEVRNGSHYQRRQLESSVLSLDHSIKVINGVARSAISVFLLQGLSVINPRRACAARVTVVVLSACLYVCLSEHAILAVRAVRSITKDGIVLSVRFAAILKRRFS